MHTVYLDGVFDLFHVSHISFIQKVREHAVKFFQVNAYDIRIVAGVVSDKDVESYKRTPVMTLTQRVKMLQCCNLVDKVIPASPLVVTSEFLKYHNIELVYHADDSKQTDFFKVPIDLGIMQYVPYDAEVSTTAIIQKIKDHY
jgi:cytidyltransferase-like protein